MTSADPTHSNYVSELFAQHHGWLSLRIRRWVDSMQTAEDIASDTFLQVLAAPNVVPIRDPRALLTTIAQRLVYGHWRRRDQERGYLQGVSQEASVSSASVESHAATLQILDRLDRRLDRLPVKIKSTFVLSRRGGLTYPEIAAHLGISQRSVSDYMDQAETCCRRACLE